VSEENVNFYIISNTSDSLIVGASPVIRVCVHARTDPLLLIGVLIISPSILNSHVALVTAVTARNAGENGGCQRWEMSVGELRTVSSLYIGRVKH